MRDGKNAIIKKKVLNGVKNNVNVYSCGTCRRTMERSGRADIGRDGGKFVWRTDLEGRNPLEEEEEEERRRRGYVVY